MRWNKCILATTLVLCILAYVAEADHQKREVHQIVIEEPRVRRRPHSHHNHHSYHRSKGHKKKTKKPPRSSSSSEENSSSFEDSDSKSNENSYEELQVEMRHKGTKYQRPASNHVAHYPPQLDADETQVLQFRENVKPFYQPQWVPVPQNQFLMKPPEQNGRKKRKEGRNKKLPPRPNFNLDYSVHSNRKPFGPPLPPFNLDLPMNLHHKPLFNADVPLQQHNQQPVFGFEFTTSLPLQYEASTQLYPVYPTLNAFPNQYQEYSGPKHISDSHNSPLIGTIEQPKVEYLSQSASNIYEVTESASEIQKVYISVPDDVKENETGSEKIETTTVSTTTSTNKPQIVKSNNRGKFRRGRPRF